MRTSKQLSRQKMKKPSNLKSLSTKEIIKEAGFVEFLDAGFPYFSPVGQGIKANLEKLLADTCEKKGFDRVQLPSLHKRELVEKGGKYNQFKGEFVDVGKDYVLTATSEEYFLELARKSLVSYTQLPARFFEIGNAIRLIQRPQSILKLREFSGVVLTSFEKDEQEYKNSLFLFEEIMQEILTQLNISFRICEKKSGTEYLYSSNNSRSIGDSLSLAMGYKYVPSPNEKVKFRSRNNSLSPIVLGTFGIGLERLFYATCDSCRDEFGFNFPETVRPYNKTIIIIDPEDPKQNEMGEEIYVTERNNGEKIYLEDRKITLKDKLAN